MLVGHLPPPPDLELGIPRERLDYLHYLPSAGLTAETGLIVYIHGWGSRFNDSYALKLLPYLADTYNCVALSVDYQDAAAQAESPVAPAPDFFLKLQQHHGVTVSVPQGMAPMVMVNELSRMLAARGVTALHRECTLVRGREGHINFGLLPALDHLTAIGALLRTYPLDRRRLFVLGTSYGGYLALLMAKLAPRTFRLVVDNSGFSGPDDEVSVYGVSAYAGAVRIRVLCPLAFGRDPQRPNYFSPSRRLIRELAVPGHYHIPSISVIHSYHSTDDRIAPTASKQALAQVLRQYRDYDLRLIGPADIDGRLFKHGGHGFDASLRGLFALSYQRWSPQAAGAAGNSDDGTDFEHQTINRLPCGAQDYVVQFTRRGTVTLSIERASGPDA